MSLFSKVIHSEDSKPRTKPIQKSSPKLAKHKHIPMHKHEEENSIFNKVNLIIELESPPAMLYGHETESTGSIISGLLFLDTLALSSSGILVDLEYVTLSMVQTIQLGKPFLIASSSVHSCKDCLTRSNTLARWDVVTAKSTFTPGSHAYPFSHLLPGSLPPSSKLGSKTSMSYVKYELIAEARIAGADSVIKVKLPVNIARLILKGPDKNSLRVFPPTDVSATAVLPDVVYPKSTFPVELRLDNINSQSGDRRWRMRKLSWRIEETSKIRAHCCEKHQEKLKAAETVQRRSKAIPKPKSSNVHYSTIQTSVLLAPDSSETPSNEPNDPNESAPSTPQISEASAEYGDDPLGADLHPLSSLNATVNDSERRTRTPSAPGSPELLHLYISEARTVSHGDVKSGWKSDFSGTGKIELVADINCMNVSTGLVKPVNKVSSLDKPRNELHDGLKYGANLACDIDDPTEGIFVSHMLIIEVVVAEETVSIKKRRKSKGHSDKVLDRLEPVSSHSSANGGSEWEESTSMVGTPTGAARVLRMQFKLKVTERSGLGISWDDEVPPTYEDVRTLSPPTYEKSAGSTPQFGGLTPLTSQISASLLLASGSSTPVSRMRTPGVLYGVGSTPGASLDHLLDTEERIQDLRL